MAYSHNKRYRQTDKGREQRYKEREAYYGRCEGDPYVSYKIWTAAEDKMIMERFALDIELAWTLGRSLRAIHGRRCRIVRREQR